MKDTSKAAYDKHQKALQKGGKSKADAIRATSREFSNRQTQNEAEYLNQIDRGR
jgi:hypothetical protein